MKKIYITRKKVVIQECIILIENSESVADAENKAILRAQQPDIEFTDKTENQWEYSADKHEIFDE